ncbi:MAG: glycoside hydrolase family 43 protein [Clostridium sp.]|nr:glycoside hydrolase family 43 protein [Clostridium sp.]
MTNLSFTPKKRQLGLMAATALLALAGACTPKSETSSETQEIFYADPTIFVEDGKYYLVGTRNADPLGFILLESDDLETWQPAAGGDSMMLTPAEDVYGTKGFWAPQVLHNSDSTYTLAYTANEQTALACSGDLLARFSNPAAAPIDSTEKNIDPFIFVDDDGKMYLYHVRFDHGNFLWVAEFDPATGRINPETLQRCFANTQDWENTPDYPSDPIMEGPTVVKFDGVYYLFYSANHFMSRDYAVGYATAPTPFGPWTKYDKNPIIHRSIVGENGSGHGDLFRDNEQRLRYVYHVHNSDSVVSPRRTRIVSLNMTPTGNPEAPVEISVDTTSIIKPVIK